jgi:hypothetical protein
MNDLSLEEFDRRLEEFREKMKEVPLPEGMHSFVDIPQRDGTIERKYSPLTEAQQEFWADFDRAVAMYDCNLVAPVEDGKWQFVPRTDDLKIIKEAMVELLREWCEPV